MLWLKLRDTSISLEIFDNLRIASVSLKMISSSFIVAAALLCALATASRGICFGRPCIAGIPSETSQFIVNHGRDGLLQFYLEAEGKHFDPTTEEAQLLQRIVSWYWKTSLGKCIMTVEELAEITKWMSPMSGQNKGYLKVQAHLLRPEGEIGLLSLNTIPTMTERRLMRDFINDNPKLEMVIDFKQNRNQLISILASILSTILEFWKNIQSDNEISEKQMQRYFTSIANHQNSLDAFIDVLPQNLEDLKSYVETPERLSYISKATEQLNRLYLSYHAFRGSVATESDGLKLFLNLFVDAADVFISLLDTRTNPLSNKKALK